MLRKGEESVAWCRAGRYLARMSKTEEKQAYYPTVEANPDFVALEKDILAFWKREGIFQQSVEQRPAEGNSYVFYDGPPFANGLPHYGHLLTGYVKDLVARYQTMRGKRVERRFGWDCHGLPAEMGAEKELGISGRQAIIEYGIGKFNDHCRESVMKYASEWERYVDRQGRWVDFQNDYKTMDKDFMESVLWAFAELYKKGLIYESYRVMPYSWAAETPLSNFETRLDNATREREDKAIYVAFQLTQKPHELLRSDCNYYLVAWTTTPWTLPSNLALAINPDSSYHYHYEGNNCYIAQLDAINKLFGTDYKSLLNDAEGTLAFPPIRGESFLNITYKPLFPYFKDHPKSFRILDGSDFIEEGSGTGVVHLAPGFGEDDQRVCEANGISIVCPVDDKGCYTDEIFDIQGSGVGSQGSGKEVSESRIPNPESLSLKGLNVIADTNKSPDEPYTDQQLAKYGLANLRIINWLKQQGKLIKQEDFKHNYPHCWRTDTPIIYRALPSWYVKVSAFKDRAVALNQKIHWIPDHTRDGAMGHMLGSAPDWSISRNRFWGCPIPVWKSSSGKIKVFGSIAELEQASGKKITDLHRPFIDEIVIHEGGEEYRRVEEVLDCWFESGSMPYAQLHYPFENVEKFKANYPGDFITEYIGQTRGWFNTLIMLATALFDEEPFKNCICHGVVIDEETGLKYSKRLKNYKDPMEVFDTFGADALRWLMVSSGVMRGHDLGVDPEGKFIRDVVRLNIKPIWNAYNFFTLYANADGVKAEEITESEYGTDWYILGECKTAVEEIQDALDSYDTPRACQAVSEFFETLNNFYIRSRREVFWRKFGSSGNVSERGSEILVTDATQEEIEESKRQAEKKASPEYRDEEKQAAFNTLYTVLVTMCKAAAPLLPFTMDKIYIGLISGGQYEASKSVHLCDFPDVSGIRKDDEQQKILRKALAICNTALSIRNKENIRVRQPLTCVTVYGWKPGSVAEPLSGERISVEAVINTIINLEVNVKGVIYSDKIDDVATHKLKINFPIAGKRLGAKMKDVGMAAKSGKWEIVDDRVIVGGEPLEEGEYELLLEPKIAKGAQALPSQDALVVLDLTLTPELIAEGLARDVVRMVQESRKKADLHISDKISLIITAPDAVQQAVSGFTDYIAGQVLAESVAVGSSAGDFSFEHELEGEKVVISFSKVA